jgi:hypothetical protein
MKIDYKSVLEFQCSNTTRDFCTRDLKSLKGNSFPPPNHISKIFQEHVRQEEAHTCGLSKNP